MSVALDVPLDGSLHVLYGLNGAGKTVTLETLRKAFGSGAPGGGGASGAFSAVVHVVIDEDVDSDGDWDDEFETALPLVMAISDGVRAALRASSLKDVAFSELSLERLTSLWIQNRLTNIPMRRLNELRADGRVVPDELAREAESGRKRLKALADEVTRQRRYVLVSSGGAWSVGPSCAIGPKTPLMAEEIQRVVASWATFCRRTDEREHAAGAKWFASGDGSEHSGTDVRSWKHEVDEAWTQEMASHDARCATSLLVPDGDPEYINDLEAYVLEADRDRGDTASWPPFYWEYPQEDLTQPLPRERLPFIVLGASEPAVESGTREYLKFRVLDAEAEATGDSDDPLEVSRAGDEELTVASLALGIRASALLAEIMPNAPELMVASPSRSDVLEGRFEFWRGRTTGGADLNLDDLSFASRRLARLAIEVALAEVVDPDATKVVLLDEPDLGLHRMAERRLFSALERWAARPDMIVIASSHSPAPFAVPNVQMHHVERLQDDSIIFRKMTTPKRAEIEALGLSAADLLPLVRVILLVEGRHDEVVLERLFGEGPDGFAEAGVHLLAMHGGRKATSAIDSALIWDYSDAKVAVLLDRVPAEALALLWNEVLVRLGAGGQVGEVASWFRETATRTLAEEISGGGRHSEIDWIVTLGSRAIERRVAPRLVPMGHPADDILAYLPEGSLGAPTWQIAKKKGLVTDERLIAAVGAFDEPPAELAAIHRACIDLAI